MGTTTSNASQVYLTGVLSYTIQIRPLIVVVFAAAAFRCVGIGWGAEKAAGGGRPYRQIPGADL